MDRSWVRIIIIAAIAFIIISILIGLLIFLFSQFINLSQRTPAVITPTFTPTPTPTFTPTPTPEQTLIPVIIVTPTPSTTILVPRGGPIINLDVHQGPGFSLFFPQNWGLLTCANSANFEFDPVNNLDQNGVFCNVASKPITVLVSNNLDNCPGATVSLGNIAVIKSVTSTTSAINYKWCTITQPVLKITHRVSPTLNHSFSREDFSQEVEFVISTLRTI